MIKLTHIYRKYYRKFMDSRHFIARLIIVFIIVGSFLGFSVQHNSKNSSHASAKVKSASISKINANTHIIEASKYIKIFYQDHDTQNLGLAREELQITLGLDPKNIFALNKLRDIKDINVTLANQEIGDVQKILNKRPDYALAWTKLAILYEILGENNLAHQAMEKAKVLNGDL